MGKNKKIIGILLLLFVLFGITTIIEPISAMNIPTDSDKIDSGNKTIHGKNKLVEVSWNTSITNSKYLHITKKYKTTYKKTKTKIKGNSDVLIEKIGKNKLKITKSYSTGPPFEQIKYLKTKRSIESYYWNIYSKKYLEKIEKPMLSKSYVINKGKSHNKHTELKWKAYTYNNYPQVVIEHNYHIGAIQKRKPGYFYIDYFTHGKIELKKVSKNQLRIIAKGLVNSKSNFNNKVIYLKTKLSAKSYYLKYYKSKMIKYFLN